MAKYVIAGKSDCNFFARAELLADELQLRLPEFSVHKIILKPEEWQTWLSKTCDEKGWSYSGNSPIIWRELINRGGKGMLVGGCNEFLELAKGYYGISCTKPTNHLKEISAENKSTKELIDSLEIQKLALNNPCNVTVINARSHAAYNILPHLCKSNLFGCEISLTLHCLDNQNQVSDDAFFALAMELEDCAFVNLKEVLITTNVQSAIKGTDFLIIITNSTNPNVDKEKDNLEHLKNCGNFINSELKKTSKIIVCGEHALRSTYVISKLATKIPSENIFTLTRTSENRLKSSIAKKLNVITSNISDVILWGAQEHYIIDLTNARVKGYDGALWAPHIDKYSHIVKEVLFDKSWIVDELPQVLVEDGKRKSLSTSSALISQLNDILNPTRTGLFSLGCISKGWYGVPEGLPFSFPVTYLNGKMAVKDNIELSEEFLENIVITAKAFLEVCENYMNEVKS